MKKRLAILIAFVLLGLSAGIGYAAFMSEAEILGTTVTVGSTDIKLLDDLSGGFEASNLVVSKAGPSFQNIEPGWVEDYPIKIFNNGTGELVINTYASYETANDPADLRQDIYVEPFIWSDANGDGLIELSELSASLGPKTIVKWKTEGFKLGTISPGHAGKWVLRFSAPSIADSKQGATAVFDFEFTAVKEVQ